LFVEKAKGIGPGNSKLKEHIEIDRETPAAVSEEVAVSRVVHVGMDGLRIEVIGQIKTGQLESNGILGIDPDVLRNAGVDGSESGETGGIRDTDVLLRCV